MRAHGTKTWKTLLLLSARGVFAYKGATTSEAGNYDGMNVVSFDLYKAGVIEVTYLWSSRGHMIETDTILNTYYDWSLGVESNKMNVENIMTHEFGHWCGLNDLYKNGDYWLTMYGYSNYAIDYATSLGLGDVKGVRAVYGN